MNKKIQIDLSIFELIFIEFTYWIKTGFLMYVIFAVVVMLTPYLFIRRFGKAINIDTNNIPLSVLVYAFLSFALVSLMLFMYLLLIVSSKWFHSRGSEDYFELTSIGIKFDDGMSFYLIPFENIKEICEGSYFLIIKTRGRSNFSIPKRLFSDPIVKRGFVQEVRLLMKNARNS